MTSSGPKRLHHIDFVVRDLESAATAFARVLGTEGGPRESLASRGVDLVRFRIGETWLILVQPTSSDSPVMEFLERRGEGFFHLAIEVEDVEAEAAALRSRGVRLVDEVPRRGVEGWKLIDVEVEETAGAMLQFAEVTAE